MYICIQIHTQYDPIITSKSFFSFSAVKEIFSKINCDSTPITDMLGSAVGVTEMNMIQYLGLIEQRANELLATQAYLQSKVSEKINTFFEHSLLLL